MAVKIRFAARSDVGKVRTNNEDNLYCNGIYMTASDRERPFFLSGITESPAIFAVADGMGGEDSGELASLTAVEALRNHAGKILRSPIDADKEVTDYVRDANSELLSIMRAHGIRMGTTIVLAVVYADAFRIYNLGDSRGFRVENGRLLRVTADHTLAEDKMRMGYLTPEQADKSRERHILTRCLGDTDAFGVAPDVNGTFSIESNSRVLMCSDGLTDMLSFPEIAAIMQKAGSPAEAVNALVDSALVRGGRDNVTCIVFEIVKGE